jgi:hypothetical protein
MPRTLEFEALRSAAGTLPPAIEVNTTEACTADGNVQRKTRPIEIGGLKTVPDMG